MPLSRSIHLNALCPCGRTNESGPSGRFTMRTCPMSQPDDCGLLAADEGQPWFLTRLVLEENAIKRALFEQAAASVYRQYPS